MPRTSTKSSSKSGGAATATPPRSRAKSKSADESKAPAKKQSPSARGGSAKTDPAADAVPADALDAVLDSVAEAVSAGGRGDAPDRPAAAEKKPAKRPRKKVSTTGSLRDMDIMDVWVEYKREPTEYVRNHLIEYYLDIVKYTAERMHMRLPGEVNVEDLMSAGIFGLIYAIDAFDLERGVKFETYCAQRIRGAIFDELRAMDWVPRLVRARTAKVERVRKQMEMQLGRKPTDDEVCERLNVDKPEFEKLSKDSRPVGVVSLNRKWFETDSSKDIREIDVIQDTKQDNPLTEIQRSDLKFLITKGLSRAERLIIVLYYYEEMTMKEIGMTLDLSESRVSQMHSSILARLKAQMQHREKEF